MSLPSKLSYQTKIEPAAAKSYRSNIQPQNGTNGYTANNIIIFNLPTRNNLVYVPTESYLKFNATITNTSAAAANYYRFDGGGAHGFFRRIRVFHGSNLLEDIDNYDMFAKMMMDCQMEWDAQYGKYSILAGTRSDLIGPTTYAASFTSGTVTAAQCVQGTSNLRITQPKSGALLWATGSANALLNTAPVIGSTAASLTIGGTTTYVSTGSGTALAVNSSFTTPMYCINLISMIGTLCNEKYFPLFACTSAPIRVEIQLVPYLGCAMASDSVQNGSFTLNNVEYVMNTIELGDSAMQTIQSSLNGGPLQFALGSFRNYTWNGSTPAASTATTTFSMPIAAKFSSLKSIIIATRDNTNVASGNVNGFFPHSSNKFLLNQAYFRIGSVVLPPKFPTTSAEYYAELLKAVGSMSDLQFNPAIDYMSYNQDFAGVIPGVLFGPSSAIPVATDTTGAATNSGTFYYAIDLENYASASKSEIFAGHNTNTDDIFYNASFQGDGTNAYNIRFDAYAHFDQVLVFESGTVYVKF
jgi:hypothetical protein